MSVLAKINIIRKNSERKTTVIIEHKFLIEKFRLEKCKILNISKYMINFDKIHISYEFEKILLQFLMCFIWNSLDHFLSG